MLVVNKLGRTLHRVSKFPHFRAKAVVANLEMQSRAVPGMEGIIRATLLLSSSFLGDLLFHLPGLKSRFYVGEIQAVTSDSSRVLSLSDLLKSCGNFFSAAKLGV